jgi:OOP family OmpA-OmpF porin
MVNLLHKKTERISMMKKRVAVLAIASMMITSAYAGKNVEPAESPVVAVGIPFYIGIGGVMGMTSATCRCAQNPTGKRVYDTTNFGGLVRIGYDFNPYFGVEARLLHSSLSRRFAKTTHYGLYAKPQLHVSDALNLYGLIGYGHTRVECIYKSKPIHDDNGWSFGGGFEYDFGHQDGQGDTESGWGMFADYQNLLRDAGSAKVRSNIISAGLTYDF